MFDLVPLAGTRREMVNLDNAFLANHLRMFYSCAAYTLIHSLRENIARHHFVRKSPASWTPRHLARHRELGWSIP